MGLFILACEKENSLLNPLHKGPSPSYNIVDITDQTHGEPRPTVFGNMRENPFTVEIVAQAHNQLYGTSLEKMATTDLYVKFTPSSPEDLEALELSDAVFFDYPLEHEVVEMGDYNPNVSGDFYDLYAVVKPDFDFPAVDYEIVEELHLLNPDAELYQVAFDMTGNGTYIPTNVAPLLPCDPDCTNGGGGGGSGPGPGGCYRPSSADRAAGRISVWDTELGTFEGVSDVRVVMKDNWFVIVQESTNSNGCFVSDRYFGNKMILWVKFKNSKCKIRSTYDGGSILEWFFATKAYIREFDEDVEALNAIHVKFHDGANASVAHRNWGAATVNNAVDEFHELAIGDNILPPHHLNIFINRSSQSGVAIMANYQSLVDFTQTGTGVLLNHLKINGWLPQALFNYLLTKSASLIKLLSPDLIIGSDYSNSDQLKRLAFHEIAHASHHRLVGSAYWRDLSIAEINAGIATGSGHGDQFSQDAGLIAVVESWAEYIGMSYTHRIYGLNNSVAANTNYWQNYLEATHNESDNHIPIGMHHDLADNTPLEGYAWDDDDPNFWDNPNPGMRFPIDDQVNGFTNQQMFQSLNSNVSTPDQYRVWLNNNFTGASGNTANDINDLFNSY